jgi:hypothetical protein
MMVEDLSVFEAHGLVGVGGAHRIGLAGRGGPMVARTMGAGG